jgi:hypothetical protein
MTRSPSHNSLLRFWEKHALRLVRLLTEADLNLRNVAALKVSIADFLAAKTSNTASMDILGRLQLPRFYE